MLKRLFFLLLSFSQLPLMSHAQNVADDFEGNGSITTWFGDDCGMDNAFANPFQEGINTSATVLKYTDTGGTFANIGFNTPTNFDLDQPSTFSLAIYIPSNGLTGNQPNQISLKLQDGTLAEPWSSQTEIIQPVEFDQWQLVSFDFTRDDFNNLDPSSSHPVRRNDFNRVLLQVNGENNQDQVIAYIDNFSLEQRADTGEFFQQLVWADECDGNGPIDANKWHHQTQLPNGTSWFNGELQHYTNRVENSYQADGFMYIMAKKESFTDQGQTKAYTSARLNSKFAFTYGRVEVRAKLPFGLGTWPAIWMLGKNITENGGYWAAQHGTTGWPACGEIDIMEHWGYNQNYVQSALHTPSSFGNTENHGGLSDADVSTEFHVYGLEWMADKMYFSIDGTVFYTYAPDTLNADTWPFEAEQYILLNVAMQGDVAQGFTQSPMVIDYVRVYQEGPPTSIDPSYLQDVRLFPNPVDEELRIEIPDALQGAEVKVYTYSGQLVETMKQEGDLLQLDWSRYRTGFYLVVIETDTELQSYKVLKK